MDCSRALGRGAPGEVHEGQVDADRLVNALPALRVERRPQRGVTLHHLIQGASQRVDVESGR